jgi:hypothetical protein
MHDFYDVIEENPAAAIVSTQWPEMKKIRDLLKEVKNLAGKGKLECKNPSVSRVFPRELIKEGEPGFVRGKKKKRRLEWAGKLRISGGPYIKFSDTLEWRSSPTDERPEGRLMKARRASLFTWTTKMSCASFSVPAGPARYGGTCAAARQQSVEDEGSYVRYSEPLSERGDDIRYIHTTKTGNRSEKSISQQYICDVCYAGKGSYRMYINSSVNQIAHRAWADARIKDGTFRDEMVKALTFLYQNPRMETELATRLVSNKYFRLHDSGDFWSKDYYLAWRDICQGAMDAGLPIKFWAPTRQWVFKDWIELFREFPPPKNLSLRPSALYLGSPPPVVPELLSAGTTSFPDTWVDGPKKLLDPKDVWPCPAMNAKGDKSCINAPNPQGGVGCRTCWDKPKIAVNYSTH